MYVSGNGNENGEETIKDEILDTFCIPPDAQEQRPCGTLSIGAFDSPWEIKF